MSVTIWHLSKAISEDEAQSRAGRCVNGSNWRKKSKKSRFKPMELNELRFDLLIKDEREIHSENALLARISGVNSKNYSSANYPGILNTSSV
ncbi:hypothetical protein WN51_12046 [Melipona quadrifasciata]|uniref:Uncharacterized protein n=1 Tax=Melipona quadrifasciata TaxID=166423 RepID=A0A0M9A4K4_9HYME|nr:hypothetical protein WN51_12046 [Melipona quadrifasciata]